MKKLLLLFVALSATLRLSAQDNDLITGALSIQGGRLEANGLNPMEFSADLGVRATSWLAITVRGESSLGLFKSDIAKTYQTTETAGGVLDFKLFSSPKVGALSLQTAIGCTIGGSDWKYTYYQAGVFYSLNRHRSSPYIGFGVRYYNSRTSNFDSYTRGFATIGFRLF